MASESYGPPPLSDEGFIVLSQIFCAFAHGAGGLLINGDAILAAHRPLGRGSTVIDKGDYVEARLKTRSSDHHFCPFPHHV